MIIGVPKEIKNHEYRVGLTPASVGELVALGHQVLVEQGAGEAIDFTEVHYRQAGASICSVEDVFARADLIVKVKEPQAEERARLRAGQTLFTYLHLAPDEAQTRELIASGAHCIAYETVTNAQGQLPLLSPMSEVAGRMSIQAGARCLEKSQGGRGLLLGGVAGVESALVVILGGGVVGFNATQMAVGLGARVVVIDQSVEVLRRFDQVFGNRVQTQFSSGQTLREWTAQADLMVGCVLVRGARAPKLVTKAMVQSMKRGSVLVDVAIDQGGCFETSRPTTHDQPTFVIDGVVHYCVANMPGAVPRTSTLALNNMTLPFVVKLANKGVKRALQEDPYLLQGLNVAGGHLCCPSVGEAQGVHSLSPEQGLKYL